MAFRQHGRELYIIAAREGQVVVIDGGNGERRGDTAVGYGPVPHDAIRSVTAGIPGDSLAGNVCFSVRPRRVVRVLLIEVDSRAQGVKSVALFHRAGLRGEAPVVPVRVAWIHADRDAYAPRVRVGAVEKKYGVNPVSPGYVAVVLNLKVSKLVVGQDAQLFGGRPCHGHCNRVRARRSGYAIGEHRVGERAIQAGD